MQIDLRQALGLSGEDLACDALTRRGYAIVERRYRTRAGEIDIIARDDATLVFVEVKTRITDTFGGAAVAVTAWKQRRLRHLALDYISRHHLHDLPCRFDVVAIDFQEGAPVVTVYRGAF